MTEQATEKQIAYAKKLGIENPEQFSKQALRELIDQKLGNKPKPSQNAPKPQIETSQHTIVINRTEKPHSFEFGKAGNRFKIYYSDIEDLKNHLQMLENAGLSFPTEKPGLPEDPEF